MDNIRFILLVLLCSLSYMLWDAWQKDYGPKPELPPGVKEESLPAAPGIAETDDIPVTAAAVDAEQPTSLPEDSSSKAGERIHIRTDLLSVEIDTLGGTITQVDLLEYPISKEDKSISVRLLKGESPGYYVAQSGILSNNHAAPNHYTLFQTVSLDYRLTSEVDSLTVPLTWSSEDGITVTKLFTFNRGSYLINVQHQIDNKSSVVWQGRQYKQLQREALESDNETTFIRTYTGGVIYNEETKYEKISFDDMFDENLSIDAKGGWSAIIQHYFLTAWVPPADDKNRFYTKSLPEGRFVIGSFSEGVEILPNQQTVLTSRIFSGPKIQQVLEQISPGLELTVDYGFLTVIAKPIFWLLSKFHSYLNNWGWSIICVTFVIKLVFFKLSEASYRSMARMRKLQPQLQSIRERCGDDRQRMNQEIMGLYKKEKVNPLGGCLPILVQIPVFISLYWVLLESVELRHAPFLLWLDDLSARDPLFVLPLLMGLSMWFQQRLNPAPLDPLHEKVMKLFPVVFTIFFMFFPSGLVLYWVVNNSLSILQQWYITRRMDEGYKA